MRLRRIAHDGARVGEDIIVAPKTAWSFTQVRVAESSEGFGVLWLSYGMRSGQNHVPMFARTTGSLPATVNSACAILRPPLEGANVASLLHVTWNARLQHFAALAGARRSDGAPLAHPLTFRALGSGDCATITAP